MTLLDLMGSEVISKAGLHRGHLIDLRCLPGPEGGELGDHRVVTHLVYAKIGWMERLGFTRAKEQVVEWGQVELLDDGRIRLAAGVTGRAG